MNGKIKWLYGYFMEDGYRLFIAVDNVYNMSKEWSIYWVDGNQPEPDIYFRR